MKKKTNIKECIIGDTLDLSMSDIQEVPVKEIATFTKINHLDLSNNQIVQLSDYFPLCLTHITKLDISFNKLTSLPKNFGSLSNLRYLDLSKNKITTVPLSFGNLRVLNWLDISENPLVPKIAEVVGVCSSATECQQSAKKLVAFMAEINKRVNMEKERMKEVKKLEAEQAELEMLKQKDKKDKKKKKKMIKQMDTNGKGDMNDLENDAFMQQHVHSYAQVSRKNKPSIAWRFLTTVSKIWFYTVLLSFFAIFVIKLLHEPTYDMLKQRANKWASEASTHLPKGVIRFYYESAKLSATYGRFVWRRLTEFGQRVIEHGTGWYTWFSTDETVQLYVDSLWHFFHALYVQIMDLSITLYGKFTDWLNS